MTKKLKNLTTKLDFALFRIECEYWLRYFNLKDWSVYYEHELLKGGMPACCNADSESRLVQFSLGTEQLSKLTIDSIKLCAFHEASELLLWEIREATRSKEVAKATHRVIRTLENTIFMESLGKT